MSDYTARVSASFASERACWAAMADDGASFPFQRGAWLDAWASTKGRSAEVDMLAVTISDGLARPVMALPLVRERAAITRIGFADAGLSDYNAPILTARAPQHAAGARAMWQAVLSALPRCDQVRLERMPSKVGRISNPLTLLAGVEPSSTGGLALEMPETFAAWLQSKPRRYRMEIGRCARLFDALSGARFERISGETSQVMEALETMQRGRIAALGRHYALDGDAERRFYRTLVAQSDSGAILTSLRSSNEIIAALLGIRVGSYFVMLRIGAANTHANLSPARQLIVRTMELLRADGVTDFDFGLGDYTYKRKLGGEPVALFDFVTSRSLTGLVDTTRARLRARLRANSTLRAAVRRVNTLTGRKVGEQAQT